MFSVVLYGVESWTLTGKRLEAFEMWLYRRNSKIPWTAHVTNQKVLEQLNKETEILNAIKNRNSEYLGHIIRNSQRYELLRLILQGKVEGRRGPAEYASLGSKILEQGFQCPPQ